MGRQIRFYQLQEDALNFLDTFYKEGVVLYDYRANCLENYRQIDFTRYFQPNSTDVVGSYFLAYRTTDFDKSLSNLYKYPGYWMQLVEFTPTQISKERQGYLNEGRFFLDSGLYENVEMSELYKKLVKYVKKNYVYCKELWSYIAPCFMEKLKNGEVVTCNAGTPYKLKL